jgi:hypothetical protein
VEACKQLQRDGPLVKIIKNHVPKPPPFVISMSYIKKKDIHERREICVPFWGPLGVALKELLSI